MDLIKFQRELGVDPEILMRGLTEAYLYWGLVN